MDSSKEFELQRRLVQAESHIAALEARFARIYARIRPPSMNRQVWVKVTGNAAGGGKYDGKIINRPIGALAATSTLAEADCAETTPANTTDVLIFNVREVGKDTHDLEASGFLPLLFKGDIIGATSTGTPVVRIDGRQSLDCPTP